MTKELSIRRSRIRLALMLVPWAISMGIAAWFEPQVSFSVFLQFPYGLSWLLSPSSWHDSQSFDLPAVVAGWMPLLVLTGFCRWQIRTGRYIFCYVALCLTLGLTIIGWWRFWVEIAPLLKM